MRIIATIPEENAIIDTPDFWSYAKEFVEGYCDYTNQNAETMALLIQWAAGIEKIKGRGAK